MSAVLFVLLLAPLAAPLDAEALYEAGQVELVELTPKWRCVYHFGWGTSCRLLRPEAPPPGWRWPGAR